MAITEFAPPRVGINVEPPAAKSAWKPVTTTPVSTWVSKPAVAPVRQPLEAFDSGAVTEALFDPRRPDPEEEKRSVLAAINEALTRFDLADDNNIGRRLRSLGGELRANAITSAQARMELDGYVADLQRQKPASGFSAVDAFRAAPSPWTATLSQGSAVAVPSMFGPATAQQDAAALSASKNSHLTGIATAPPAFPGEGIDGGALLRRYSAEWGRLIQEIGDLARVRYLDPDVRQRLGALGSAVWAGSITGAGAEAELASLRQAPRTTNVLDDLLQPAAPAPELPPYLDTTRGVTVWPWEFVPQFPALHGLNTIDLSDPRFDSPWERAWENALQTVAGATATVLGGPVDLMAYSLNKLFGTDIRNPIGGREFVNDRLSELSGLIGLTVRDPNTEMNDAERVLYGLGINLLPLLMLPRWLPPTSPPPTLF